MVAASALFIFYFLALQTQQKNDSYYAVVFSKLAEMFEGKDLADVTDYAVHVMKSATASQGLYIAFIGDHKASQSLNISKAQAEFSCLNLRRRSV